MKQFIRLLPLALVLGLSSCGIAAMLEPQRGIERIERGMSREQVTQVMGRPDTRSLAADGSEQWEYRRSDAGGTIYVTQITFYEGRVTRMDNHREAARLPERTPYPSRPQQGGGYPGSGYPGGDYPGGGYPRGSYEAEQERRAEEAFSQFIRDIQSKPFDEDKFRLIRDVAQRNYFTTEQTIRVLRLFSWDDEKFKVLRILAPRIRDSFNAHRIIDLFTWDDDKARARKILQSCPPSVPIPPGGGYGREESRRAEEGFDEFIRDIQRRPFKDDKIRFIQDAARRNYFTTDQARRVLQLFSWDDDKLTVLEALAPRLRDAFNAHQLVDLFTFSSGKERARQIINSRLPQGEVYPGGGYGPYEAQRAEEAFAEFIRDIQRKPFKDDKIRFIQDAARRNYFTTDQARRVLQLFTWDDDKLTVLEALAPRLRDGFNAHQLVDLFTFSSAKERARQILGYRSR